MRLATTSLPVSLCFGVVRCLLYAQQRTSQSYFRPAGSLSTQIATGRTLGTAAGRAWRPCPPPSSASPPTRPVPGCARTPRGQGSSGWRRGIRRPRYRDRSPAPATAAAAADGGVDQVPDSRAATGECQVDLGGGAEHRLVPSGLRRAAAALPGPPGGRVGWQPAGACLDNPGGGVGQLLGGNVHDSLCPFRPPRRQQVRQLPLRCSTLALPGNLNQDQERRRATHPASMPISTALSRPAEAAPGT